MPDQQVNRITLQLAQALIGQGASVVFGHDWREDGVMEAVHGFAQQIRGPFPMHQAEAGDRKGEELRRMRDLEGDRLPPPLINILPWPGASTLDAAQRKRLEGTLLIATAAPPPEELLDRLKARGDDPRLSDHARGLALAKLREELTRYTDARICIGGQITNFKGILPGIIEEALRALDARKPVYLCGLLGGATARLIESFEEPRAQRLARYTAEIKERIADIRLDPRVPYSGVEQDFLKKPFLLTTVDSLAETNGLSVEENRQLFQTRSIEEVIYLVLKGIGRLRDPRPRD